MHKRARNHKLLVRQGKDVKGLNRILRPDFGKIGNDYKDFIYGYEPQGKRLN
ncbi:MAG: hypothetical protein ABF975_01295 [Liquorilactobacillus hordei]|uniref:hypothetical protein n=1 Tax=Liquorilactobacillus hordei TaxID=468911 RepID=UPI0039EBB9D9